MKLRQRLNRRSNATAEPYVVTTPRLCAGKPYVRGTRIRVEDVALWHECLRLSVEQIDSRHPQLSRDAIQAALAFYCDHRHEVQLPLQSADALAARLERLRTTDSTIASDSFGTAPRRNL